MDQTFERVKKSLALTSVTNQKIINPSADKNTKALPSFSSNLLIGLFAAVVEVGVNHPFFVLKTRMQCGYSFTVDPRILYRGVLGNAASMIPLVCMQVSFTDSLLTAFSVQPDQASVTEKLAASFTAGALSATVANPVELVLVQQQKTAKGFLYTGREFTSAQGFGALSSGLTATAARTGVVSCGFIGLMPHFKKQFQDLGGEENLSSFAGGACAGIIATALSHPFDTIKTHQQKVADVQRETFSATTRKIFRNDGVTGFFKGITARGARVISATVVLGHVKETLTPKFSLD